MSGGTASFIHRRMREISSNPPVAARCSHFHLFGKVDGQNRGFFPHYPPIRREDPYNWLRDDTRSNPEVMHYLKQENLYCESAYAIEGMDKMQTTLYNDLLSHYKENDTTVPSPDGNWFYYSRLIKNKGYKLYCRRQKANNLVKQKMDNDSFFLEFPYLSEATIGPEVVLFDVNEMAEGLESFFFSPSFAPNPDHSVIAYATDIKGNEVYDIKFKTFTSESHSYNDVIIGVQSSIEWSKNGALLFYLGIDAELRPYKLFAHRMGTSQDEDICLYEEKDPEFNLVLSKTSSRRFLRLASESKDSNEIRIIDLNNIDENEDLTKIQSMIISKRREKHLYDLDDYGDYFFIVSNKDESVEGKLWICKIKLSTDDSSTRDVSHWKEVFHYDESITLSSIKCFASHCVVSGRKHGSSALWILDANEAVHQREVTEMKNSPCIYSLDKKEECGYLQLGYNYEYDTTILRYEYESLTIPKQTIEIDMTTRSCTVLHTKEVPNFNSSDYVTKQFKVLSHDKRFAIPISMAWKRDFFPNGVEGQPNAPLVMSGYGSYGISKEPLFNIEVLNYLNRGAIYAIAHIRGGGELGRFWYEKEGKYFSKKNTFYDFVTCVEYLQQKGITSPEKTAIIGRSAGGMLMGASMNLRPDLFQTVIADVPFVDILNTMADPTIPLTTGEWQEWGNPNELKFYYYMLEYSPYDNIRTQRYPNILFKAGLYDPRVPYWEPAKFVAKLRTTKTDNNLLLLKTDMAAGHFSQSNRYKFLEDSAFEQAFVLRTLDLKEA